MRNEAHLPTEQDTSQKNLRFSSPNENRRGTQSIEAPPPRRTQNAGPLTGRFPKHLKLRKSYEFQELKKQGQRLVGQAICIDWSVSSFVETRLGITASRRYGNACARNRFKRLVREAFRQMHYVLPPGLDLNVLPRQRAKIASFDAIRAELISLIHSAVICP